MLIARRFTFEAHHRLPWHNGKCARDHGHSYVLEVAVRGPIKLDQGASDSGMVMDFADISEVVKPIIEIDLDHHSLNDLVENPTAEIMVLYLVDQLTPHLPGLARIRLWETANSYAEWEATP